MLSLGTTYRVVVDWSFVSGPLNDTFKLYVSPTDPVQANDTPYYSTTWASTSAEPAQISAFNFRQGTAASAPAEKVDNLGVSTTFAEALAIPEPASLAMMAGAGLLALRTRRAKRA